MTLGQALAACKCGEDEAEIVATGCMGLCSRGPLVRVESKDGDPTLYGDVSAEVAQQIIARHVPLGGSDDDSARKEIDGETSPHDIPHFRASLRRAGRKKGLDRHIIPLDLPFFSRQVKVVLNEIGRIDPSKLEDYLAHGGYQALHRVLEEMTPEEVCDSHLAERPARPRAAPAFQPG